MLSYTRLAISQFNQIDYYLWSAIAWAGAVAGRTGRLGLVCLLPPEHSMDSSIGQRQSRADQENECSEGIKEMSGGQKWCVRCTNNMWLIAWAPLLHRSGQMGMKMKLFRIDTSWSMNPMFGRLISNRHASITLDQYAMLEYTMNLEPVILISRESSNKWGFEFTYGGWENYYPYY